MGLLSWLRTTTGWSTPRPGSTARGVRGQQAAPAVWPSTLLQDEPATGDRTPRPMTNARLCAWFARHDYTWFVDNDGDVGGLWRGRLFYFFLFGERSEILQVRGQWNREFAIERLTDVLEVCNEWNAERIWPKAYVRVRDDGMVHVTCEVATDLEHGATDAQLDQLLQCGLGSAGAFFDHLDGLYPDPAAVAP